MSLSILESDIYLKKDLDMKDHIYLVSPQFIKEKVKKIFEIPGENETSDMIVRPMISEAAICSSEYFTSSKTLSIDHLGLIYYSV